MRTIAAGFVALVLAAPAWANPAPVWPQLGVEASIDFTSRGAIRNYEADDDEGIWIEDMQHRWYYGKFIGPCRELAFSQGIGFDTQGSARFDRSSKIVVGGDRCMMESFVTAEKPLPRKEREKLRQARQAAERAARRAAKEAAKEAARQ